MLENNATESFYHYNRNPHYNPRAELLTRNGRYERDCNCRVKERCRRCNGNGGSPGRVGSGGRNGDFTCDDEVCERTTLLEEAVDELEDNAYDSLLEAKDAGIVIKQLKV